MRTDFAATHFSIYDLYVSIVRWVPSQSQEQLLKFSSNNLPRLSFISLREEKRTPFLPFLCRAALSIRSLGFFSASLIGLLLSCFRLYLFTVVSLAAQISRVTLGEICEDTLKLKKINLTAFPTSYTRGHLPSFSSNSAPCLTFLSCSHVRLHVFIRVRWYGIGEPTPAAFGHLCDDHLCLSHPPSQFRD